MNNKRNVNKKKNKKTQRSTRNVNPDFRIPRSMQPATFFPSQQTKTFEFRPLINIIATGAQSYALREIKINSPFDPEYATGGNQPEGFNTMMAAYSYCIVEEIWGKVVVTNRETDVGINYGLIFRDAQPSLNITNYSTAVRSFGIGPRVEPVLLGFSTGQNRSEIIIPRMKVAAILGNPLVYEGSYAFACPANADPSQVLWMDEVIYPDTDGITMPNGVQTLLSLCMKTRFFSLRTTVP